MPPTDMRGQRHSARRPALIGIMRGQEPESIGLMLLQVTRFGWREESTRRSLSGKAALPAIKSSLNALPQLTRFLRRLRAGLPLLTRKSSFQVVSTAVL